MAKMYYDKDADLAFLSGKTIGIVGYGSQGHAHALNLRESGCSVLVAELPGADGWKGAEGAGVTLVPAWDAPEPPAPTLKPASSARFHTSAPGSSATRTLQPLSRRFRAWVCPCCP